MHTGESSDAPPCSICGRPIPRHDRHVRFRLPEPVLNSPAREHAPGTWLSHASAEHSVMMQIPSVGAFVRALLPVSLTGGYTVTFGVWVGVDPAELQRAFAVWWEPQYQDLALQGFLANSIPPWNLFGVPVSLTVRDQDHVPYCSASPDQHLERVLRDQWPHAEILDALPHPDVSRCRCTTGPSA